MPETTEDLSVECSKFSVDGKTVELEDIDIKALLISIVDKIGFVDTLNYVTDSNDADLTELIEFVDNNYGMEEALCELSEERQKDIMEYLSP